MGLLAIVVALILVALPLMGFLLPNTIDDTVESIEPLQTMRFFRTMGTTYDPWGPVPHFVFAPSYAACLGWWWLKGTFVPNGGDYPYGLSHPHEQLGTLILAARLSGLFLMALGMAFLARELARATRSWTVAAVAVLLTGVGSPEVMIALSSSKPDALTVAFFAMALAVYVRILSAGATPRRMALLGLSSVLSVSCKELTGPLVGLLFLGVLVAGAPADPGARRALVRSARSFLVVAGLSYLAINVVYAPRTWWSRMHVVFVGKLVDPDIWASPSQTWLTYLGDSALGMVRVLGGLGTLALAWAAWRTRALPRRTVLALWLPSLGHLLASIALAGYMPSSFLLPLAVTATLPIAWAGMLWRDERSLARANAPMRAAQPLAWGLCAVQLASNALCVSCFRSWHPEHLIEGYLAQRGRRDEFVYRVNLWGANEGSSRLSYLGYPTSEEALAKVLEDPQRLPSLILVDRALWMWLQEFERRPARVEMLREESGFDYSRPPQLEPLGYECVETRTGWLPPTWLVLLQPRSQSVAENPLLVFERRQAL